MRQLKCKTDAQVLVLFLNGSIRRCLVHYERLNMRLLWVDNLKEWDVEMVSI